MTGTGTAEIVVQFDEQPCHQQDIDNIKHSNGEKANFEERHASPLTAEIESVMVITRFISFTS